MIGTEQRADSLNADLLQLCDILDISDGFKFKIGIPFYDLEILLNELFNRHILGAYRPVSHTG